MKTAKKILSILLATLFVASCFAGCSAKDEMVQGEITSDTLIIAYYDTKEPFFNVSDDGKTYSGFEVDIIKEIFDNIKDDCKNYAFVKVEDGYKLGEDTAYTDKDGNTYIAYMAIGGMQKNYDSNNEDFSFTESTITNKIITLTNDSSKVKSYTDFDGANVAIVSDAAKTAFDTNTAVSSVTKSSKVYDDANTALKDLDDGKVDAVIIDELTYCPLGIDKYTILDNSLDVIEYGFATAKYDRLKDDINEAIYELQSPSYNDKDEFTPIVKKYFSYDASSFNFKPVEE